MHIFKFEKKPNFPFMKNLFLFCVLLLLVTQSNFAQSYKSTERLALDPALEPFYHGVASGDPISDKVIIWTRVTTQNPGSITVSWKMATDTGLVNVVQSGTANTDASKDHTLNVDVAGLQPNTYYYYQFEYDGKKSLIGRTKTAPTGDNDFLRFAVVSCNDYEAGYFNAFKSIAERNDLDAVFHLGDYIYEYAPGGGAPGREPVVPANEIVTLSDYRGRYSHYRLDPDLRNLHQQYPFICVWDDHETTNNSWRDGAENHTPGTEGNWSDRKVDAIQANHEWLPMRLPEPNNPNKIFRKLSYGDLLDVFMLDTRLYDRDEQEGSSFTIPITDPSLYDTSRSLLGLEQFNWLTQGLSTSNARWKVLGQQVMMASLNAPVIPGFVTEPSFINSDQWNGYYAERQKFWDYLSGSNIDNVVVLTGDIHTSWANDLADSSYNVANGDSSVGVEFVTPSITSGNASFSSIPSILIPVFEGANPHIKFFDLSQHGYFTLDISKTKSQADWNFVSDIETPSFTTSVASSWYSNDGDSFLQEATAPAASPVNPNNAPFAPDFSTSVGINDNSNKTVIVGAYPNPFEDDFLIQFYTEKNKGNVKLFDLAGKLVYKNSFEGLTKGVHYLQVKAKNLQPGNYVLMLEAGKETYRKNVVKIQ